jgi:hypothetical protein
MKDQAAGKKSSFGKRFDAFRSAEIMKIKGRSAIAQRQGKGD